MIRMLDSPNSAVAMLEINCVLLKAVRTGEAPRRSGFPRCFVIPRGLSYSVMDAIGSDERYRVR
jgi:hypothetical protein